MDDRRNLQNIPSFQKLDLKEEEVFVRLYDYYAPKLLTHAYVRLGNQDEAKDVVSQVFLKAWEYVGSESVSRKPIKNIRALLYRMVNNQIIDTYRQKSRTNVSLDREIPNTAILVDAKSLSYAEQQFDVEKVLNAANLLRDEYRNVLVWRYLDELSISEISEVMGKSRGAVSVILYRALGDIKRILKERGF
ncbi:sigma-70 family RNA polymerase sigma factor [Candidatus Parcubacteria bacterium]|nr:MAG: sigma-70 family RNA polymerase sigma factor [Candidatus Parcubacteria bacterium]